MKTLLFRIGILLITTSVYTSSGLAKENNKKHQTSGFDASSTVMSKEAADEIHNRLRT